MKKAVARTTRYSAQRRRRTSPPASSISNSPYRRLPTAIRVTLVAESRSTLPEEIVQQLVDQSSTALC